MKSNSSEPERSSVASPYQVVRGNRARQEGQQWVRSLAGIRSQSLRQNGHLGKAIKRVETGERWSLQVCAVLNFKGFALWWSRGLLDPWNTPLQTSQAPVLTRGTVNALQKEQVRFIHSPSVY